MPKEKPITLRQIRLKALKGERIIRMIDEIGRYNGKQEKKQLHFIALNGAKGVKIA